MQTQQGRRKRFRCLGFLFGIGLVAAAGAWSQAAEPAQARAQGPVCGWELMTAEARQAMRAQMRSADSDKERDRIRADHHEQMRARAKARGVELSEQPCGQGMGPGPGRRSGMGPGRGQNQSDDAATGVVE